MRQASFAKILEVIKRITRLSTFRLTVQVAEVRVARSLAVSKTATNVIVDVCRKRLIDSFSFHLNLSSGSKII
jgi:hypothetical protein